MSKTIDEIGELVEQIHERWSIQPTHSYNDGCVGGVIKQIKQLLNTKQEPLQLALSCVPKNTKLKTVGRAEDIATLAVNEQNDLIRENIKKKFGGKL